MLKYRILLLKIYSHVLFILDYDLFMAKTFKRCESGLLCWFVYIRQIHHSFSHLIWDTIYLNILQWSSMYVSSKEVHLLIYKFAEYISSCIRAFISYRELNQPKWKLLNEYKMNLCIYQPCIYDQIVYTVKPIKSNHSYQCSLFPWYT